MSGSLDRPGFVRALEEVQADPALVGGKGAGLRRLQLLGARVPRTLVLPTSTYSEYVGAAQSPEEALERIARVDLDPLMRELRDAVTALGCTRYAVRSSANFEDLDARSFAGQYESYLDRTIDQVESAVRGCWASLWAGTAVAYRGATTEAARMAVLIQPYVPGVRSGVAFSVNPVTSNPFEMIVEEAEGHCDAVTDGTAPSRILTFDLLAFAGGARRIPAPYDELAALALKYDGPVDIEWTLDASGTMHILQARRAVVEGAYHRAAPRGWTLTFPEVFSPLGTSIEREKNAIYERVLRRIVNPRYRRRIASYCARLYHQVEHDRLAFTGASLAARIVIALYHCVAYIAQRRAILNHRIRSGELDRTTAVKVIGQYLRVYEHSIYVGYLYNLYTGFVVRALSRLTDGRIQRTLLYNALAEVPSIATTRDRELGRIAASYAPAPEVDWLDHQTAAFRVHFYRFVDRFGYVFADTNPRDPAAKVDLSIAHRLLEAHARRSVNLESSRFRAELDAAVRARRLGWLYAIVARLALTPNRWIGPIKEDRNHLFYTVVGTVRSCLLRTGSPDVHLADPPQECFLSMPELAGGATVPPPHRRFLFLRSRRSVSPYGEADKPAGGTEGVLRGIPCSPGVATGPVVAIRTRDDFRRVRAGAILVAENLRPFWTPVLGVAAGLMTSSGGVLSHGASIAREYRLPAVCGLGEAIFSIPEGQMVTINGETGEVHVSEVPGDDEVTGDQAAKPGVVERT